MHPRGILCGVETDINPTPLPAALSNLIGFRRCRLEAVTFLAGGVLKLGSNKNVVYSLRVLNGALD